MQIKCAAKAARYLCSRHTSIDRRSSTGDYIKEVIMAQVASTPDPASELSDEPVPIMQQLLDNPFLLLFLGIAMPTVLYIVWGVMEIAAIPVMK